MQPGPQFQFVPTWLGMVVILAAGLAFLAFIAVLTAVLAAGKPIVPMQRIKTLAAMLVLIVPALALVAAIGWFWAAPVVTHVEVQTASRRQPQVRAATRKVARGRGGVSTDHPVEATVVSAEAAVEAERAAPADSAFEEAERTAVTAEQESAARVDAIHQTAVVSGVLRVRGTASAPPEWEGKDPVPSNDGVLVALSSQRFATIGEAEEQATALAADYVKKFYHDEYPLRGDWTVPVSVIEQNSLNAMVGEVFEKDFGNGVREKMYRAHVRLDMNSALRKALHATWNEQLVNHRLKELGGGLGLATLLLAICAGYFRLDDWTGGKYRRRLKLAAASLLAAGGLVCLVMA